MEKSTSKLTSNKRIYLDYNATSPLAPSVKEWLAGGDFYYGNPASIHSTGKKSKRVINDTREFLFDHVGLSEKYFDLFFHSGGTEGINTICGGIIKKRLEQNQKCHFFYGASDHSAVRGISHEIKKMGGEVTPLSVDQNGDLLLEQATHKINCAGPPDTVKILNFTAVNNETGVVWPFSLAQKIKEATGCIVHVDAVQLPGKIENSLMLNPDLDAYTFSAHKFGAMKGVGFSFIKSDLEFDPLIVGGGQQKGMRSGTENPDGIYSIKLALEYLIKNLNIVELRKVKNEFEQKILSELKASKYIAGFNAGFRNANTICLVLRGHQSNVLLTAFDLAGFDLSAGPACSSGAILPSKVLLSMGFNEEDAKSSLRISMSPYTTRNNLDEFSEKFFTILKRFT